MSSDQSTVLGIDTATADVAVAVTAGGEVLSERRAAPRDTGRPRHSQALLVEVEAAVAESGGWARVGLIAVGTGPGTFTGLRIGITTARALAQARRLATVGVSSLAALARGIEADAERPRLALIDARRGELFAGLYAGDSRPIWEPFVAPPEEVAERVRTLSTTPLAAGDGSLRFRQELEVAGVGVLPDADPAHRMEARQVCALASGAPRVRPEQLTPTYLRRPDAEVWREQRTGEPTGGD